MTDGGDAFTEWHEFDSSAHVTRGALRSGCSFLVVADDDRVRRKLLGWVVSALPSGRRVVAFGLDRLRVRGDHDISFVAKGSEQVGVQWASIVRVAVYGDAAFVSDERCLRDSDEWHWLLAAAEDSSILVVGCGEAEFSRVAGVVYRWPRERLGVPVEFPWCDLAVLPDGKGCSVHPIVVAGGEPVVGAALTEWDASAVPRLAFRYRLP